MKRVRCGQGSRSPAGLEQEGRNFIERVIPVKPGSGPGQAPESSYLKMFWTPAFAGVTIKMDFYEFIKLDLKVEERIQW